MTVNITQRDLVGGWLGPVLPGHGHGAGLGLSVGLGGETMVVVGPPPWLAG